MVEPADWFTAGLETPFVGESGFTVASLLPPAFADYVRILHPASHLRWAQIAAAGGRTMHRAVQFTNLLPMPSGGPYYNSEFPSPYRGTLEPHTRAALTSVLLEHTQTRHDGWFCLWNGWGGQPSPWTPEAGSVRTWSREYLLLRGPISDVARFTNGPQIWWPADRAWCVASEIDFDSSVVGGTAALVDAILSHPDLEALRVDRTTPLDYTGDEINAGTMTDEELERLRQQL